MQKFLVHFAGRHKSLAKKARVSAQKAHTGRSIWEKAQKNSTAPLTAPTMIKPLSCPDPRRRRKRNIAPPTARQ